MCTPKVRGPSGKRDEWRDVGGRLLFVRSVSGFPPGVGVSQQEAEQRIDVNPLAQLKSTAEKCAGEVADMARCCASLASPYTALSMLIGAFIASVSRRPLGASAENA